MGLSKEFFAYLDDLFACVPGTRVKRMFGGAGIFSEGLMYAIATDEGRVALKADTSNEPLYTAEGATEWFYERNDKAIRMGYWYVPESVVEDDDLFRHWAQEALAAAIRIDQAKPPGQRKHRPEPSF